MGIFLFWRNGYGRNGIDFCGFRFDPHPGHQFSFEIERKLPSEALAKEGF